MIKKFLSVLIAFALLAPSLPADASGASVSPSSGLDAFGKVTSANFFNSDTVVINIQDLHNHKEVQENTYKLLNYIANKYEDVDVYIEGANRNVNMPEFYKNIDKNSADTVMNALYGQNIISGAEYFGYGNNKILKPLEDGAVYAASIKNFAFLIENQKKIKDLLEVKEKNIKILADKYLNANQRRILRSYGKYRSKKIDAAKFYDRLDVEIGKAGLNKEKYINFNLYSDILRRNKKADKVKAQYQLQQLLAVLKSKVSYSEYSDLLKDSGNLADIGMVFSYITAKVPFSQRYSKYPDLFNLIDLFERTSLISPVELVYEEGQIINDLLLSYCEYAVQKDAVFLNNFVSIYENLLLGNISLSEYKTYKENITLFHKLYSKYFLKDDFTALMPYADAAIAFNELNLKRNDIFGKNILSSSDAGSAVNRQPLLGRYENTDKILKNLPNAKKIKIVVAGGFHTSGINKILYDNKISYISIIPKITSGNDGYQKRYFSDIAAQAAADKNAIAAMPMAEKYPVPFAKDLAEIIYSLRQSGKNWQEISSIFNQLIKERGFEQTISFSYDARREKASFAIKKTDGKSRTIKYKKGNIEVDGQNIQSATALGTNLKMLIVQALKTSEIRKYPQFRENDYLARALFLLDTQGVLLPSIREAVLGYLFFFETDNSEFEYESAVKDALSKKGINYFDIVIGKYPYLIGKKDDTFGHSTEYGCLAYVDYDKKTFFIHSDLIEYLKNDVRGQTQRDSEKRIKDFFQSLVIHEILEKSALSGKFAKFNDYLLKKQLPYATSSFHRFLNSRYAEGVISSDEIKHQKELLIDLANVIHDVNYGRSEYGDVISIVQASSAYDPSVKSDWLAIRSGNMQKINQYAGTLADSIFEQIENQPDYHGEYVIAYRKSSTQKYMQEIVKSIEHGLRAKKSSIRIKVVEVEEISDDDKSKTGRFKVENESDIKDKKIFFVDDIISKKSDTFNGIYAYFKNNESIVQSCVFFDLSQENLSNTLSDQVYVDILNDPYEFITYLNNFDPHITKYPLYWIVRMLNDGEVSSKQFNKFINSLNRNAKRKILAACAELLNAQNKIKGVNSGDLVLLMACLFAGKKLELNEAGDVLTSSLTDPANADIGAIIGVNKAGDKAVEIDYYDWQDKIALAIPYEKLKGYTMLNVLHLGYMTDTQRDLVSLYGKKYKTVFEDEKRKLKNKRITPYIGSGSKEEIKNLQKQLSDFKNEFRNKSITSIEYAKKVKAVMDKAVDIAVRIANDNYNIQMDRSLFDIIVGGSLGKGNMMYDSDIYYDIVTPNEDMSILIDEKFAPIYSFVLSTIGLETYAVTKYSSSYENKQNMSTIPDERGIAVFLDYDPIYDTPASSSASGENRNIKLINKYLKSLLRQALENKEQTLKLIRSMTKNYYAVSVNGFGWIGNSFVQSHDSKSGKSFNTRYTILALESKLKEIIFEYLSGLPGDEAYAINLPKGVEKQIEFIRANVKSIPSETLDNIYNAWRSLSFVRFEKPKDTWTDFYDNLDKYGLKNETEARKMINDFINMDISQTAADEHKHGFDSSDFLQITEAFIYANPGDGAAFKAAYRKYRHVENLLVNIRDTEDNTEVANIAKAIVLLSGLDDETLNNFYDFPKISGNGNIEKIKEYVNVVKKSIEVIKKIEKLPEYSKLDGIRTLQNYWDNIVKMSDNPQTLLALFAYMIEKTKKNDDKTKTEDDKLRAEWLETMYNIYLPSIYRILGSGAYEYARNNIFISNNPLEYLNILKLIKKIYGADIMQLTEFKDNEIVGDLKKFLAYRGFNLKHIIIKSRVKTPYSVFEKMTSGRRYETSKDLFGKYFDVEDPDMKKEFLQQVRDLLGLHIIVNGSDVNTQDLAGAVEEFVKQKTSKKITESENTRELERIKYNFDIAYAKGKTSVPIESCIYSMKAYQDETFGRYDPEKSDVKEPHFIYKLGKTKKEMYYGGVFVKKIKDKEFLITTDDENISDDFCGNFNNIKSKIEFNKNITCFVEYLNQVYVVDVPAGATMMDVLFQPYFAGEGDKVLVVYNSDGYLLNKNISVVANGYYKISDGEGGQEYEDYESMDPKTLRARLYAKIKSRTQQFAAEADKIKSVKTMQSVIDKLNSEGLDFPLFLDILSDTQLFDGILKKSYEYNKIIMRAQFLTVEKILKALGKVEKLSPEESLMLSKLRVMAEKLRANKEFLSADDKETLDETVGLLKEKMNKDDSKNTGLNLKYLSVLYFLEGRQEQMTGLAEESAIIRKGYLDIGSVTVSDFFINSVKIAAHSNFLNLSEFWQSLILGIIDKHAVIEHPDGREAELANYYDPEYKNKIMPLISLGKNIKALLQYVTGASAADEYAGFATEILLSLYNSGAYDFGVLLSRETPYLLESEASDIKEMIQNGLGVSKVEIKVSPSKDLFVNQNTYSFATVDVKEDSAVLYISEMFLKKLETLQDEERAKILTMLCAHEIDEYNFLMSNSGASYEQFHARADQQELIEFAQKIAAEISISEMKNNLDDVAGFNAEILSGQTKQQTSDILADFSKYFASLVSEIKTQNGAGINSIPSDILKSVIFVIENSADSRDGLRQQMGQYFRADPVFASGDKVLAEIAKSDISPAKYKLIEKYINFIYESDNMPQPGDEFRQNVSLNLEKELEKTRKILAAA